MKAKILCFNTVGDQSTGAIRYSHGIASDGWNTTVKGSQGGDGSKFVQVASVRLSVSGRRSFGMEFRQASCYWELVGREQ